MTDAEHQRALVLADALFWIDCLAGIRGGNIVEQANRSRFGIHLDFHGSPPYIQKHRRRPQHSLRSSLIFVKSFPNDFSGLTTKEIDNYFTIGNAFTLA